MTAIIEPAKNFTKQGGAVTPPKLDLPQTYPWLTPKLAAPLLGIHEETIRENCRKTWVLGTHFRLTNRPGCLTYNRYQINVEAVAKWMALPLDAR